MREEQGASPYDPRPPEPPGAWPAPPAPPEVPPAVSENDPPRKVDAIKAVSIVIAAAASVAAITFWISWKQEEDLADRRGDRIEAWENELASRPDLLAAADAVDYDDGGVVWDGDTDSLTVEIRYPGDVEMSWMEIFMTDIGLQGPAIRERMGQTRALDGTREASNDEVTVTWSYHPDDGLSAVFSVDP